ncbi:MerR family transcriptional regulator [Cellulomonas xylanilytica]|uniref:MerR family transcriptional regulator n=1 Tax=Cellulomonas xylanilytica TaxID=233583 RepID=A0A510V5S7_9CELL|nr:MerR family transcriptional regulator [Cellulomonas xylanilytica]GEK22202.1 MerR family transcriptional regulator [Cellulomonas xylanilytica]
MVTRDDDEPAATPTPALAVAAVARRLGVAPATLRTWDRRYGLGPSEHSAGAHRRYSATDVERLLIMRRLTLDGVAPAESARIALATDVVAGPAADVQDAAPTTPTAVVDAALAGDVLRCARLLTLEGGPDVVVWWTSLVEPVLAALARRTVVDLPGVDATFAVHAGVLAALRERPGAPGAGRRPVVLVLVAARESRPLVAHVLAGALAEQGVDARIVGGPVGPHHAVELTAMTRARAVVTLGERVDVDLDVVDRLAREQPDLPQFVMVPDAAAAAVPLGRSVHRARTFTGLLHEVVAVATASVDG